MAIMNLVQNTTEIKGIKPETKKQPTNKGFAETTVFTDLKEKMYCYNAEIRHFNRLLLFLESRVPLDGDVSKLRTTMEAAVNSLHVFRDEFQNIIEQSLPVPIYSINELFPTEIFQKK